MRAFQLFLSVDPSLGRVNYRLLSDQTLMEMLIDGFDDEAKHAYQDLEGMYVDVCKWSGIKCDAKERVIEIRKDSHHVNGPIELCCIPTNVKGLGIIYCALTGSLDLTRLPDGMEWLSLQHNQITGEIDLTHLPAGMQLLFLNNNQLTAEIDLTHLPEGMQRLHLNSNQLTGGVDVTRLPHGMECLYLSQNRLSGSIFIWNLPPRMSCIDMRYNNFNAIAVVNPEINATINLKGSGVSSVVDENGNKRDSKQLKFFK